MNADTVGEVNFVVYMRTVAKGKGAIPLTAILQIIAPENDTKVIFLCYGFLRNIEFSHIADGVEWLIIPFCPIQLKNMIAVCPSRPISRFSNEQFLRPVIIHVRKEERAIR